MTALTPDLAALGQAPPAPAATPGAEAHPSASAPGVLPGETSPSPGSASVEEVLEALHWSEVDDELTGPDRSEVAHDIACGRVTDAARVLLCGRRVR
ncbi:hypothetical protein [Acrocarpospora catenulata]|uniref:hypothetical protein n=1 Tax=Acrocarpospora catenulata TaxID=2836182 RepID=UPI001BDADA56|nr:hypothetical protein [Acrocarpospora catenulata]